jgi:glucokinase
MVAEADRLGDPLAREVIDSAIRYLGIGLSNLVNLLNPEAIVVGGGVSKLGARLLIPLRRAVKERSLPAPGGQARVLLAELGDEVGVIGAAALVTGDLG